MKNYYKILELPISATLDDIKKQYRKLCKKYHPDVYNDDKKMIEINEAFNVLSNENQKKKINNLDQLDNVLFDNSSLFASYLGDLDFNHFYFNHSPPQQREKNDKKILIVNITLEDIHNNTTKKVEFDSKNIYYKRCISCIDFHTKNCFVIGNNIDNCNNCLNICNTCIPLKYYEFETPYIVNNNTEIIFQDNKCIVFLKLLEHETYNIFQNNDIKTEISIDFQESISGFKRYLKYLDNTSLEISWNNGQLLKNDVLIFKNKGLRCKNYKKYNFKNEYGDLYIIIADIKLISNIEIKKIIKSLNYKNNIIHNKKIIKI